MIRLLILNEWSCIHECWHNGVHVHITVIEEEVLEVGLGKHITTDSVTLDNLKIPSEIELYKVSYL